MLAAGTGRLGQQVRRLGEMNAVTTHFTGLVRGFAFALLIVVTTAVVVAVDGTPARAAAPVAVDDLYTTSEDTSLMVPAPGVLANDTDSDGDPLTAVLVTGPLHGTLTLNADGSFTYTPSANFNGLDAFT